MKDFLKNNKGLSFYLVSSFFSSMASKIYMFAIPWLIYEITESSTWMGMVFLLQLLPSLIVSPFVGTIVDIIDRKIIIFLSNFLQGILLLVITTFILLDYINLTLILIICIVLSIFSCFSFVSEETIIPQATEHKYLVSANTFYQFLDTIAVLSGPALAGVVITLVGIGPALLVGVFCFVPVLISIFLLEVKYKHEQGNEDEKIIRNIVNGFKYVRGSKILLIIMSFAFIANIAHGSIDAMFIYFARDHLQLGAFYVGLIFTLSGIAQFIFGLITPIISKKLSHVKALLSTGLISGLGILIMSFFSVWPLVGLGRALQEGPIITSNILNKTLRQSIVPNNLLGRVNSINNTISMISYPLAGFLSGIFTDLLSITFVFKVSAFILISSTLFIWFISFKKTLNR